MTTVLKKAPLQLNRNQGSVWFNELQVDSTNKLGAYATTLVSTTGAGGTGWSNTLNVPINDGDILFFNVKYLSTHATLETGRVQVMAGNQWQSDLGALTFDISSTARWRVYEGMLGPFESARFGYKTTSSTHAVSTAVTGGGKKGESVIRMRFIGVKTTNKDASTPTYSTGQGRKLPVMAFKLPKVEYDA